jgi:hypothetical protein
MAGKFLRRGAIIDTLKSEERTNAIQKRNGLTMHPVQVTSCGCPDPNCGAWHTILTERKLLRQIIKLEKQVRRLAIPDIVKMRDVAKTKQLDTLL